MIVQYACPARSTRTIATDDLGRPNCPACGGILLVAEASSFNVRGRIDHAWCCDDCGHGFVTSVSLPTQRRPL